MLHDQSAHAGAPADSVLATPASEQPPAPVFYTLPASALKKGMSTADGQDVLELSACGDLVTACVYTARSDDPELDEENRGAGATRSYDRNERVELAVFSDTRVDGTRHPLADLN